MKKINLLLLLIGCFCLSSIEPVRAQQKNLQAIFDQIKPPLEPAICNNTAIASDYTPNLSQLFEAEKEYRTFHPSLLVNNTKHVNSYPDTLIVGVKPYDTLIITGTLTHNGPIWVALNGVLIIKHATLTNIGDMDVFNHGKVIIDSSTVSFPQAYFY
ncbi:MAG TPA: hypothetical protein VN922_22420, partial [Bacteroidia bacterium]|nr:hypothetical protein [Bacteroidia bacterium]